MIMKYVQNNIFTLNKWQKTKSLPLVVYHIDRGTHVADDFHSHNFMEIAFIRGSGRHVLEHLEVPLAEGDVLVVPPGFTHAYEDCADLEVLNLLYDSGSLLIPSLDGFQLPFFRRLFPLVDFRVSVEEIAHPVFRLESGIFEEIWNNVMRLDQYVNAEVPGRKFLALGCFLNIVGQLAAYGEQTAVCNPDQEWLVNVISFMDNNLQSELDIDSLARMAMMSPRNFFRRFKQMTGMPPLQYWISLRVRKAIQLLQYSNMTHEEIAEECGFYDANYMAKVLKRQLNISPRELRK